MRSPAYSFHSDKRAGLNYYKHSLFVATIQRVANRFQPVCLNMGQPCDPCVFTSCTRFQRFQGVTIWSSGAKPCNSYLTRAFFDLKTSREGNSTTSFGSLFQWLIIVVTKNVSLISHMNLIDFCFPSLPFCAGLIHRVQWKRARWLRAFQVQIVVILQNFL